DQWLLLVKLRLALDDRCEREDLVEGHLALGWHLHLVVADRVVERVEHLAQKLFGRGVRQDPVRSRPQEAFERRTVRRVLEDALEPRVAVEQRGRWLRGEVVELVRVHLEPIEGLELGRDLLEPKTRPQVDLDVWIRWWRKQRRDHLIGRHVLAEHEGALLERARQVALAGDEDEGSRVLDEALVAESRRDPRRRIALSDDELHLGGIRRDGLGEGRPEVLPDDVGDERQPKRGRTVLGPRQDRPVDDRAECGQRDDEDDRRQEHGEEQEPDEPAETTTTPAAAPARPTLVAVPPRGLIALGDVVGRVGVRVEPADAGSLVARAAARADRHGGVSIVGRSWENPGGAGLA